MHFKNSPFTILYSENPLPYFEIYAVFETLEKYFKTHKATATIRKLEICYRRFNLNTAKQFMANIGGCAMKPEDKK